jgi:hypothetical protein
MRAFNDPYLPSTQNKGMNGKLAVQCTHMKKKEYLLVYALEISHDFIQHSIAAAAAAALLLLGPGGRQGFDSKHKNTQPTLPGPQQLSYLHIIYPR